MQSSKTYFILACFILVPLGIVSSVFNWVTKKVLIYHWPNYPQEITVRSFVPDTFTILLHQTGPLGVAGITVSMVIIIGLITFVVKPRTANLINAWLFVISIYFLATSLISVSYTHLTLPTT